MSEINQYHTKFPAKEIIYKSDPLGIHHFIQRRVAELQEMSLSHEPFEEKNGIQMDNKYYEMFSDLIDIQHITASMLDEAFTYTTEKINQASAQWIIPALCKFFSDLYCDLRQQDRDIILSGTVSDIEHRLKALRTLLLYIDRKMSEQTSLNVT